MCGIIGIVGTEPVAPLILEGLKRLEYRGYDSAGIATLVTKEIRTVRAQGKLIALEALLKEESLPGSIGIGHTRWATHGVPSVVNAHPHVTDHVAVVHNGIIENYRQLRKELDAKGVTFVSETDTEVVPRLLDQFLHAGHSPKEALHLLLEKLEGAFALAIICKSLPDSLLVARKGSPLAIGLGEGKMFVGSDAYALAPWTNRIIYLEEGDSAIISKDQLEIFDASGTQTERPVTIASISGAAIGKGHFRHFMQKEIYEQPTVLADTLQGYCNTVTETWQFPAIPCDVQALSRITIIACGTSYYAGMVAKYWIESLARISVDVDIASEYRYREPVLQEKGLAICISQSGETADTLAALKHCKSYKQTVVSVLNVVESSMGRLSDVVLPILAGPEIGVASTKAFTTQLMVLACFALHLANMRGTISKETSKNLLRSFMEIPGRVAQLLTYEAQIETIAKHLADAKDVLYIGRGTSYPIALEGALKLKELSYIHAEGIAAGELKHGPIALIDNTVPVIVLAPHDAWFEKTASNVQEVVSRGGQVIAITDQQGAPSFAQENIQTIVLPSVDAFTAPLLYAVPVQLLAYHVAVHKGTDVDQPRNLAKSVTVE